mgnify:CR=1 FL=1
MLQVSGPVEWVESEADINAVTALSGSGPAYVFYLVECMAEAGRKAGLPADLAETAQIGTCESNVVPPPAIVTAPAPIDTAPLGFGERFPPGGPPATPDSSPPPAPALPSTIDVPSPTPPEPHRSRRDRKR